MLPLLPLFCPPSAPLCVCSNHGSGRTKHVWVSNRRISLIWPQLVQSPRSDAAPYSGTDKTHLGPRSITPGHYQQTQTRVTSAHFVSDRIPESDIIVSPRSSANRQRRSIESGEMVSPRSRVNREQLGFQMSSELHAEVQVAAAQVNTHYVEESQQVKATTCTHCLSYSAVAATADRLPCLSVISCLVCCNKSRCLSTPFSHTKNFSLLIESILQEP